MSEDLLVATINAIVPGLPEDVPRAVAAVCERSPKLAVVIAEQIKADPTLVPTRFVADGRARNVLDRYLELDPGDPSWKAVSGVALLERVGWTRDVEIESERLFDALNLIPVDARHAVDDVHRRLGVVPTAGRYRYVSPAILADHLAARQMESWTQGHFRRVQEALTPAMADSFARRLRRLASVLENRSVVGGVFFYDYIAGAFSGSPARRTRNLLARAREWLTDPRAVIRQWARKVVDELEAMLQRDETWEAEERFLWPWSPTMNTKHAAWASRRSSRTWFTWSRGSRFPSRRPRPMRWSTPTPSARVSSGWTSAGVLHRRAGLGADGLGTGA